jgi:uncharacterized protein YjbI with pentapeptide repeats
MSRGNCISHPEHAKLEDADLNSAYLRRADLTGLAIQCPLRLGRSTVTFLLVPTPMRLP